MKMYETQIQIPLKRVNDGDIVEYFTIGFHVALPPILLQDKGYFEFDSGGIQFLCEKVGILPCVLDAAMEVNGRRKMQFFK